jgi:hypothetical protein
MLVIPALVDLYESVRPEPLPVVVIELASTKVDVSSISCSKSSPAVVDADAISASVVVSTVSTERSPSTRVNTASVDRPGIAGGTRSSSTRVNIAFVERPSIASAAIITTSPT